MTNEFEILEYVAGCIRENLDVNLGTFILEFDDMEARDELADQLRHKLIIQTSGYSSKRGSEDRTVYYIKILAKRRG
jgi:hypothetical protein